MKETTNLKVVPAPTARSPEREALAAAIVERDAAARELAAAKTAADQARSRQWAAEAELSEFRAARDEQSPDSFALDFIEAAKAGTDCDVITIGRRDVEAREREAELQNTVDLWSKARVSCESAIPGRENDVMWADRRLDAAARAVIASHSEIPKLLDKARELHDALDRSRNVLVTIANLVSGTQMEAPLREYLTRGLVVCEVDYPICLGWRLTLKGLLNDADAALPGEGS